MCTHARMPSGSRRNDRASSKSFAVSGSIVYVSSVAEIDPVRDVDRPELVLLERLPVTPLDEQRFEHVLDVVGATEVLLDVRAAATGADDGEIAALEVAGSLQVERDRHAGREVRLADQQLAAAADLDDDAGRLA